MKLKNIYIAGLMAFTGVAITGCDDFLDDNRYPETQIVNNPSYWNNSNNCQLQVNRFYQYFYGYGNGNSTGDFYFKVLTDDQCGNGFTDWKFQNVPASSSSYTTPYSVIRGCNIIIENVQNSTLSDIEKNNYIAQARLNRGWRYYQLVRQYGDVVLVDKTLDLDSPELYAPRTDRKTVMDFAYEDLKFASENITLQSGIQKFSKDLALAMLSEVCLYEGTFWKYCTQADNYYEPDAARSKKFLELCAQYSEPLIARYPISANYRALYNSAWSANASEGITGLSSNKEVIFATQYEKDVFMHSTVDYTCSSTAISGLSKDAFDAYLFKDGKPLAFTTLDKSDVGEPIESGLTDSDNGKGMSIAKLLEVRDGRLAQTTDPYIYYKNMTWARSGAMQMTSSSGYGVAKYDNVNMPVNYRSTSAKNYTCPPLFWGAVICLNYAEAKAELGTLTDDDINKTLNKLYERAELPNQSLKSLTDMNDPANNMGISSLLWEVRRCRRCELIMDNDFRYWDLVRWHQLEILDNTKYPNVLLGANAKGAPVAAPATTGDYINATFGKNRIYDPRQYEWPLPQDQMTLNKNLKQNPNWE